MGRALVRAGGRDRPHPLARPDRPRCRTWRQGGAALEHAARMDLLRLRRAERRRHRRPDLPDELARGVPLRARELGLEGRRRRGRGAARQGPCRPGSAAEAGAHRPDRGRGRDRDRDERPRGARRGSRPGRVGAALPLGDRRGRLHLHLHLRHDGAAEGLRDQPRQLPRDARHDSAGAGPRVGADRLPVPAARPLLRSADPARQLRHRRGALLLGARSAEDRPQPDRGPPALLPVGAADLREDLHGGDRQRGEGGRAEEARLLVVDRRRPQGPRARAPRRDARVPAAAGSTRSPTSRSCRRSGGYSVGASPSALRERRRSTPRSCASSTPPAS